MSHATTLLNISAARTKHLQAEAAYWATLGKRYARQTDHNKALRMAESARLDALNDLLAVIDNTLSSSAEQPTHIAPTQSDATLPEPGDMSPDELAAWDHRYVMRLLYHWRERPLTPAEDDHWRDIATRCRSIFR